MQVFRRYSWSLLLFRNYLLLLFLFQSNDLRISLFLSFGDALLRLIHYWSWKLCLGHWWVQSSKSWFCTEIFLFSHYSKKYMRILSAKSSARGMAVQFIKCIWSVLYGLGVVLLSWLSTRHSSQLKRTRNCIFRILVGISHWACLAWI